MARTGDLTLLAVLLLTGLARAAEPEFYMTADHTQVGTEDTFRVEIVVANAPEGSVVQFPSTPDFEVLGNSQSTQMSYSVGAGGAGIIKQLRKYTLTLRANRPGTLTIPPAGLQSGSRTFRTEPVTIQVVKGRTRPDPRAQRPQPLDPFGGFPFGGADPFEDFPPAGSSDTDLFVRAVLDKKDVFVGEQATLSLLLYSRIDLAQVTSNLPRLEGFLTVDFPQSNTLGSEVRVIDGVEYREYVVRRQALFARRPGTYTIDPSEVELTTGFVFAGRRISRKSNALSLKVKPIPGGGPDSAVGQWRLSATVSQTEVALGDPLTLTFKLEGTGNLQLVQLPPYQAPAGLKLYDAEVQEKQSFARAQVAGSRTFTHVLVAQQTGTFTLPARTLRYFDPVSGLFEETTTEPITLSVKPGQGAPASAAGPTPPGSDAPKNQLKAGALRPLRFQGNLVAATATPPWAQAWFLPLAAAPAVGAALLGLLGALTALGRRSSGDDSEKRAREARRRLKKAQALKAKGTPGDVYAEVTRATMSFLEARLGPSVHGLTRPQLAELLALRGVPESTRARLLACLETCDEGRYAPGASEPQALQRAIDDAAHAMEALR